jgi:hypothetical protein
VDSNIRLLNTAKVETAAMPSSGTPDLMRPPRKGCEMKLICTNCNDPYTVQYEEPGDSGYCQPCEDAQDPCECGELCCNMGETCKACAEAA